MPQLKLPQSPGFFKTSLEWCYMPVVLGLLSFMLFSNNATATHIMGNDISYRYIDSQKYEVTFRFYRDCRAEPFSDTSVQTRVRCLSGSNKEPLNIKLVSIQDITPVCKSDTLPCSPQNTKGSRKGIEMLVYKGYVNFADSQYMAIYSCGKIIIEVKSCCRSTAITTCGAGSQFYNFAMLDLSIAGSNSSPVITSLPEHVYLCCNQPVYQYFDVQEYDLCDSISYHLSWPLTDTGGVACNSGYSYDSPFTYYDPFNQGKPFPFADPPIGFYFDNIHGGFIVDPTKCGEVTPYVYEVREWRKDSSGVYQHIGTIRREMTYSVESCGVNNSPRIPAVYNYSVCEGDNLSFTIWPDDKVPPPPNNFDPDTVLVSWPGLFSDAKLSIVDSSARIQKAVFNWKAKAQKCSYNQHSFTIIARDDECPLNAMSSRTFIINVTPRPIAEIRIEDISCGLFRVSVQNAENIKKVKWEITDRTGKLMSDTASVKFLLSNRATSGRADDTLFLRSNDSVIVHLKLWNGNCVSDYYDTIYRFKPHHKLFSWTDTIFCDTIRLRIFPDLTDTSEFTRFQWNTAPADTFSSIVVHDTGVYRLQATSVQGCEVTEHVRIQAGNPPAIRPIPSDTFCHPSTILLQADSLIDDGGIPAGFIWDNGSTRNQRILDRSGTYYLAARNFCGEDTVFFALTRDMIPNLSPIPDDTLCIPDTLRVSVIDLNDSGLVERTFKWNDGFSGSDRKVDQGGMYQVIATSKCGADTTAFFVTAVTAPHVDLGPDSIIEPPFNITLNADTVRGTYEWSTGDTTMSINAQDTGVYWVKVSNYCGSSSDTVRFTWVVGVPPVDQNHLQIKPNPFTDAFEVQLDKRYTQVLVRIREVSGREVFRQRYDGLQQFDVHFTGAPGVYLIEVYSPGNYFTVQKILKEK